MRRQYGQHCLFRRKSDKEIDEEAAAHLQEVKKEAERQPEIEAVPVEERVKIVPVEEVAHQEL